MSTYMAYLEDGEREFLAIDKEMNAEWAMIESMLDVIDAKQNARYEQAEAKVIAESGTIEDLQALYTEADNEAGEQKQGIFASIIGWFKKIFGQIKNWIMSKFGKIDPNTPVTINKEDEKNYGLLKQGWAKFQGCINAIKQHKFTAAIAAAATIAGTIAGGWTIKKFAGEKITKKYGEVKAWTDDITKNIIGWVDGVVDKIKEKIPDGFSTVTDKIKEIVTEAKDWVSRVLSGVGQKIEDGAEAVKNGVQRVIGGGKGDGNGKPNKKQRQLEGLFQMAKTKASKHYQEAKVKYKDDKGALAKFNSRHQSLQGALYDAYKAGDKGRLKSVAKEIDKFVTENSIDSDMYSAMMLEGMYEMFNGKIDSAFFEFCMSPDVLPSEIYYDFYQEEVDDILGFSMESDNNEVYSEEAIAEDTADILDALAILD